MSNQIIQEDIDYVLKSSCIDWNMFKDSNILITGATGLICSMLVKTLASADIKYNLGLIIYCSIRNMEKAEQMFRHIPNKNIIRFIINGNEETALENVNVDYIIHGAAPTASKFFIECPVETISAINNETVRFLEIARKYNTKSFVYLSSMEAYGQVRNEELLTEDKLGIIDLSNVRSSYPESKRMCELICKAYSNEYNIRAMSIRLAQTFGPGVSIDDNRVFAMMARNAIKKEDIVLLTKGESKHPYLYTAQAVEAILCVLLDGECGETYNAANPETYCSIYEMAIMVAEKIADGKIKVVINESSDNKKYPPASYLNLDITKIKKLGWNPSGNLKDIFDRMIKDMITES